MVSRIASWIKNIPVWVYFFLLIHLIGRIAEHLESPLPYPFNAYLDDVLFIPLLLWITESTVSRIYNREFKTPLWLVVLICLYVGFTTEWIFPRINDYFVFDYWDFVAYLTGGFGYYLMVNRGSV